MVHLNNPNVYEPLGTDISPTLKELITEKLKALRNNGFLKQAWFEFYKPPKQIYTHIQTLLLFTVSRMRRGLVMYVISTSTHAQYTRLKAEFPGLPIRTTSAAAGQWYPVNVGSQSYLTAVSYTHATDLIYRELSSQFQTSFWQPHDERRISVDAIILQYQAELFIRNHPIHRTW